MQESKKEKSSNSTVHSLSESAPGIPGPPQKESSFFKPPFDLFGMQTSFFLNGEDKTVTWFGFIFTIVLAGVIIAVSLIYTVNFFRNVESKVYINDVILDAPPILQISNRNFLLMFKHIYPETGPLHGQQDQIFKLRFHYIITRPDTEILYQHDRVPLTLIPCKNLELKFDDIKLSEDEIETNLCANFPQDKRLGGSYTNREEVNLLDILVSPCMPQSPSDCVVNYNGTPTSTFLTDDMASEYFRDYILEVNFIESTHDVGNFEKPLVKNIRKLEYRFNSRRLYFSSIRLSQIKSITSSGTFSSKNKTEEGMFWQSKVETFMENYPTSYLMFWYNRQFIGPERTPYAMI